jgi:hypothetical protein
MVIDVGDQPHHAPSFLVRRVFDFPETWPEDGLGDVATSV